MKKFRRVLILAGVCILLLAALLSGIVYVKLNHGEKLGEWVFLLSRVSKFTKFSELSGLGYVGDVYYAVCLFVFPISLIVSYVWIVYEEDDWRLSEWMKDPMDSKKRFYSILSFLILVPLAISFLFAFRGQDARLLSISNNFYSMAMKGWIPLAVAGAIAGGGFSFIRKVFIGR